MPEEFTSLTLRPQAVTRYPSLSTAGEIMVMTLAIPAALISGNLFLPFNNTILLFHFCERGVRSIEMHARRGRTNGMLSYDCGNLKSSYLESFSFYHLFVYNTIDALNAGLSYVNIIIIMLLVTKLH